jgi:hypothetical protein
VIKVSIRTLTEAEQIIIPRQLTPEVSAAIQSVRFIAQHIKDSDKDNEVSVVARNKSSSVESYPTSLTTLQPSEAVFATPS